MAEMQLLGLSVTGPRAGEEDVVLCSAMDLSQFGFFQRGTMRELTMFFFRTFTKRTEPGTRATIPHEGYLCHVYVRPDGLGATAVVSQDYPDRVAFTLLNNILEDFEQTHSDRWHGQTADDCLPLPSLEGTLKKYQNPAEADKLMAIQKDLDEIQAVMHENIEAALQRGAVLDDLIEKTADLSASSKLFYRTAKKHNQCCEIM